MYVIGLTGNVACGKSTVGAMLAGLGARYVDTDLLAHEAIRRCGEAYQPVVDAFGAGILAEDGRIDRRALARIVFSDPARLRQLETIVHPVVMRLVEAELRATTEPVVVLDAIKLIESGLSEKCDAVWVVACPREQQVERLVRTRGMSEDEANLRIDAQPPQAEKVRLADVVIDNAGNWHDTRDQVMRQWDRIVSRPGRDDCNRSENRENPT